MGDDWEDDVPAVSAQPSGLTAVVRMYHNDVFLKKFFALRK